MIDRSNIPSDREQPPGGPTLPERLARELHDLYTPASPMTASRDAATIAAARQQFPAARSRRWRMAVGAGLAAAVAVAAALYSVSNRAAPDAYVRTGDIRDAYFLARTIESASDGKKEIHPVPSTLLPWDANVDGRIDRVDVQALALAAVHIGRDGGGGVR
jgi:hypothetical protein